MKKLNINFKSLSKKQIIIISVVTVLVLLLITWGSISIARNEDPITAARDIVTGKDALIGNWQEEGAITAYVFYEDGTYQSYISSFPIDGHFELSGNKITLRANSADGYVTYKYYITGDTLVMTLVDSNGKEPEAKEEHTFQKVDELNMKTPIDILQEFAEEIKEESESSGGETTTASDEEPAEETVEETTEETTEEDAE